MKRREMMKTTAAATAIAAIGGPAAMAIPKEGHVLTGRATGWIPKDAANVFMYLSPAEINGCCQQLAKVASDDYNAMRLHMDIEGLPHMHIVKFWQLDLGDVQFLIISSDSDRAGLWDARANAIETDGFMSHNLISRSFVNEYFLKLKASALEDHGADILPSIIPGVDNLPMAA